MVAGLPEQDIRIISPDLGGGFGNKVPIYPGYVVATAASLLTATPGQVGRDAQRESHLDRLRARLLHEGRPCRDQRRQDPRTPRRHAERPGRVLRRRPADEVQGRAVPRRHRQLRLPGRARHVFGRVHEQGTRRGCVSLLVPHHRGVVPDRAARANGCIRVGHRSGRLSLQELHPARSVSVPLADRVRLRLRRLPHRVAQRHSTRSATKTCAPSSSEPAPMAG